MRKSRLKPSDVPEAISILGKRIPIRLKKIELLADEEATFGHFDQFEDIITIDIHTPKDIVHQIIVHEAVHAVFHLSGLTALIDHTPAIEEALVRALTSAFASAIDLSKLVVTPQSQEQKPNPDKT